MGNDDYVIDKAPFPNRLRVGIRENSSVIDQLKAMPSIPCEAVMPRDEQVTAAMSRCGAYEFRRARRLIAEVYSS